MSEAAFQVYKLQGKVETEGAVAVKIEVEEIIDQSFVGVEIQFDELDSQSSLVVGLMMGWIRHAYRQEKQLVYSHLPARLLKIIEFSGLTKAMPLREVADAE